jgi:F0F1-type ATP synthase assembly protein I
MEKTELPRTVNMWALAGELGFLIALPLAITAVIGVKVDRWLGTTPLFIILGMLLAAVISALAVRRKIKQVS